MSMSISYKQAISYVISTELSAKANRPANHPAHRGSSAHGAWRMARDALPRI
jgi:hypothetical protein